MGSRTLCRPHVESYHWNSIGMTLEAKRWVAEHVAAENLIAELARKGGRELTPGQVETDLLLGRILAHAGVTFERFIRELPERGPFLSGTLWTRHDAMRIKPPRILGDMWDKAPNLHGERRFNRVEIHRIKLTKDIHYQPQTGRNRKDMAAFTIRNMKLPETVRRGIGGRILGDVVDHPALAGLDLVIDSAHLRGANLHIRIVTIEDPVRPLDWEGT